MADEISKINRARVYYKEVLKRKQQVDQLSNQIETFVNEVGCELPSIFTVIVNDIKKLKSYLSSRTERLRIQSASNMDIDEGCVKIYIF